MVHILIDTCVWLDMAKDPELKPLLGVLEEMTAMQAVAIIMPRAVLDEFDHNKKHVVEQSSRSLSGTFKRVKDAVDRFGDPRKKQAVLKQLNDIDQRIPRFGESAFEAVGRIESLIRS